MVEYIMTLNNDRTLTILKPLDPFSFDEPSVTLRSEASGDIVLKGIERFITGKVVRCVDCRHNKAIKHGNKSCQKLLLLNPPMHFYCGYGEEADDGR